jgi:hypothetical protein
MTTYQITGSPETPGVVLTLTEDNGTFTLSNDSTISAVVTSIHFETDVTPTIVVGDTSEFVSFTLGDKNLPQGNAFGFDSQAALIADSPAPKNGVGAGEQITFTAPGYTGHIGLHVQSIGEAATSATYIAVPEPSAALLLGIGVVGMICKLRNR